MTRNELITTIEQIYRLYMKRNRRKARLLFNKIKPSDFGDLKFRMSHGMFANGGKWIFYVERDWDDKMYCRMFLQDALDALRANLESKAA
jgi:hypothetical protein